MNDLQFATAISPQIGDFYAQAKAYRTLVPGGSLVFTRSVGAECCDLIAELNSCVLKRRETIDSRITELSYLGLIDGTAKHLLHSIRVAGNQGAHPEDSKVATERLPEMALVALENCRNLFKWLWRIARPGEEIPHVEVSDDDPGLRQQMCQRAALDGDAEAQHMLWKIMNSKAAAIYSRTRNEAIANNGGMIGGPEFAKAVEHSSFWSKQAAESRYPPAMYQRGIELARNDDKDVSAKGVVMVRAAADLGEPDSMALVGCWHARGQMGLELNYGKARALFEAVGSHPIALAELGRLYLEGLGVDRDEGKALELTLQSADAGFADGQFAAFKMIASGQGCLVDENGSLKWLRLAADQGHLKALITLARILRMHRRAGSPDAGSFEEIDELIRRAMPDLNEVKLEMVELLLERGSASDVVNAASLLQQCYQTAVEEGSEAVAHMCVEIAPRINEKLELSILKIEFNPSVDEYTKRRVRWVAQLFDERGLPRSESILPEPSMLDRFESDVTFDRVKLNRFIELSGLTGNMRSGDSQLAGAKKVQTTQKPAKARPNDRCPCGSGKKFKLCHGKT